MARYYDAVTLKAANKATANQSDQVIDCSRNGGFNRIILDCSKCTTELAISIDVPVSQSEKIIYISPIENANMGLIFDEYIRGSKLYYSCTAGTNTFNYILL